MNNFEINSEETRKIVENALYEDIAFGDITTNNLIDEGEKGNAYFIAKEEGIIAGLPVAEMVFKILDKDLKWKNKIKDGDKVKKGTVLAEFEGYMRAILTGERTALNFLQRMSGIATETNKYVEELINTETKILDTRKTVPGLRLLDKYAVKIGGGTNHRIGLYDMVLIKDNHIEAAGSISNAVKTIRGKIKSEIKIEVETRNFDDVKEALSAGADIIMLDNMNLTQMKEAVKIINGKVTVEASGNVTMKRIKEIAETGVDFISVGALTHSVKALDISQYIK